MRWAHRVVDLIFPGVCTGCAGACEGGAVLCEGCEGKLEALAGRAACGWCASPLAYEDAPCPYCVGKGMPLFDRVVSLGVFDDPVRQVVHAIKYHGAWPLAEVLAERLIGLPRVAALLGEVDVIVPVPLHPLRKMGRGFNQAELIARRIGRRARVKVADALVRVKHTQTQTNLHSRARRDANVEGAFGLDRVAAVRGKRVLLVDDVMTTGATLRAAARAVRGGKPASVCGLVVAVADPKGHGLAHV